MATHRFEPADSIAKIQQLTDESTIQHVPSTTVVPNNSILLQESKITEMKYINNKAAM